MELAQGVTVVIPAKAGIQSAQGFEAEIDRKVSPSGIGFFDQPQFPGAVLFLDPLFAKDRVFHRAVRFQRKERLGGQRGAHSPRTLGSPPPFFKTSSVSAQTSASARSGERPGPS